MNQAGTAPDQKYFIRLRGRILGPFDLEKLRQLRARGQFSRLHEISVDRRTWQSAATLDQLFRTPVDASKAAPAAAPTASTDIALAQPLAPMRNDGWYCSLFGQQQGPLSLDSIRQLIASGQLQADGLVSRSEFSDWCAANSIPEFAPLFPSTIPADSMATRRQRPRSGFRLRTTHILLTSLLLAPAAFGAALYYRGWRPKDLPYVTAGPGALSATDGESAEQKLAECVGMVVCGLRATLEDGTVIEQKQSQGTCFVVSPDGYAITNKHVIEEVEKLQRAKLRLEKIRKEQLIDIEPRIWAIIDSRVYKAELVHSSDNFDLGILRIDRHFNAYFRLAREHTVPRGTDVVAFGFPAIAAKPASEDEIFEQIKASKAQNIKASFKPRDLIFTRTDGSVSRLSVETGGRVWIQHTANINPGNSGGPLVGRDGTVWAINTLAESDANLFLSLATDQLREEIDANVKDARWK